MLTASCRTPITITITLVVSTICLFRRILVPSYVKDRFPNSVEIRQCSVGCYSYATAPTKRRYAHGLHDENATFSPNFATIGRVIFA